MVAKGTLTGKFADFTASNSSHVYNQLMEAEVTMCLSYDTIVSTMLFSSQYIEAILWVQLSQPYMQAFHNW